MIAIENVRWKDTEVVHEQEQFAALWWSTARQTAAKRRYSFLRPAILNQRDGTNQAIGRMSEHIEGGDFANHSKLLLLYIPHQPLPN
jgi:hypothetical protein